MLANMIPGITAAGSTSTANGESTSPQAAMITRMYAVEMRARVAPHRISPVITSSMLTGVAIIASNVRWFSIRQEEPHPHRAGGAGSRRAGGTLAPPRRRSLRQPPSGQAEEHVLQVRRTVDDAGRLQL